MSVFEFTEIVVGGAWQVFTYDFNLMSIENINLMELFVGLLILDQIIEWALNLFNATGSESVEESYFTEKLHKIKNDD